MTEFCGLWWHVHGYTHACLKREGHDGPHLCCSEDEGGYPGGVDWTGPVWRSAESVIAAMTAEVETP